MIFKLFQKLKPADHPLAILPGAVIARFPLLSGLPDLIGLDLRLLTEDKFKAMDIALPELLDGTMYSGRAMAHPNYLVYAERGEGVNGFPFWVIDVFFRNITIEFMQELCINLVRVYGAPYISYGAGKYTSYDLTEASEKKAVSLKCWLNQTLDDWVLKKCELWLRMYEHGRIANLHFHVHES